MHMVRGFLLKWRMTPVIAWSMSAFAIAIGYAVHDLHDASAVHWEMLAITLLSCLLLQGVVARAFDESRTTSPSLLLGTLGALGTVLLGAYVARSTSGSVWVCTLVGVFIALSYTAHPFRNMPALSEWVTAFPAMMLCCFGTYYLLSDMLEPAIGWAALLHSLLSIAWLMQVQLKDIAVRGRRDPREVLTTVGWAAKRFGKLHARHVPAGYFLLTAFLATIATLQVNHVFLFTILCSLLGAFSAWNTNPLKMKKLTETQGKMITMTLIHGLLLSLWVAWM